MADRPRTDYSAPVLCVDLAVEGYEIWPCHECLPWHLEVLRHDNGDVFAREWHAADCPHLQQLLTADDQED